RWECSCLQKKCGACAMVINGKPCLACDAKLGDVQKRNVIRIEPLRKFPVVCDLVVDRSILFENLKTLTVWLEEATIAKGEGASLAYEASRCLQCGCCLEICPNFAAGGRFYGMAGFAPTARLISELPPGQQRSLRKLYRKHIYEGCGKSLACRNVCPAGLDIDRLLVNSNAAAIWKFPFRKDK
ncbi:MAG: 4Fe-4S dicluster domain-containing protein, partial [Oscillospiraceae bacterium]|nr:4Fe-4S dicluster domain-containing protein [Oscillospiraceae bacterium]